MKLTLWQQYSSNHSSSFTVIGEFPTPKDAQRASRKIRAILKKIADWYKEQDVARQQGKDLHEWWFGSSTPTPPEQEIAEQYQVEWQENAIDWFGFVRISIIADRFVHLAPKQRPETDARPFNKIMDRLGAKVFNQGDPGSDEPDYILLDLTCDAPDEATAETLYLNYLGFDRRIYRTGTHLHFYRWQEEAIEELPQLMTYLKKKGCINMTIGLSQHSLDDEFELYDDGDLDVMLDILKYAKSGWDRSEAAELLISISDAQAVEPLIEALADENRLVRQYVLLVLGKIGDTRAITPLKNLLADEQDDLVRQVIESVLKRLEKGSDQTE